MKSLYTTAMLPRIDLLKYTVLNTTPWKLTQQFCVGDPRSAFLTRPQEMLMLLVHSALPRITSHLKQKSPKYDSEKDHVIVTEPLPLAP